MNIYFNPFLSRLKSSTITGQYRLLDLQKPDPNIEEAWTSKEKHYGAANFASIVISLFLTISKRFKTVIAY